MSGSAARPRLLPSCTHTNIVSVFDTGEDELDGAMMPYIVMEYVEGEPLGSVLQADIA